MHIGNTPGHPGHTALRHGRCSLPGQIYLVTTVAASRREWFGCWPVAVAVAREIGGDSLWRDSRVHAWVLMPDHMHVLLTLGTSESLSHLMNRVKTISSRAAHRVTASASPLWVGAFHDHALRRDEEVVTTARYVIANPVRAGLVHDIWAWSLWDCEWLHDVTAGLDIVGAGGRAG